MNTAAIHPKGARSPGKAGGPATWALDYLCSTVGQKILVALTGAGLVSFVFFHMIGNLKMFNGAESINKYAYTLKHDFGALIWIARAGLLGAFLLHLTVAIRLKMRSMAARPIGYYSSQAAQATFASRTMLYTGIVILLFTLFHLAHYTFLIAHKADLGNGVYANYGDLEYTMPGTEKKVHNVYEMVIAGFTTPWLSAIYVVAQLMLFIHLSHGISSALNTLGLVGRRFGPAAKGLAIGLAATILIGNLAIVGAVQLGVVKTELKK